VSDDEARTQADAYAERLKLAESLAPTLVGLDEASANSAVAQAGLTVRVERRDGRRMSLRDNLRVDRIDLTIERGVVTAARVG
jgi:hypothetical protein